MNYLPLIIVVVVLFGAMTLTPAQPAARAGRSRQQQREQIGFGTEVMTTSGLYGTVVGRQRRRHGPAGDRARRRGQVGAGGAA